MRWLTLTFVVFAAVAASGCGESPPGVMVKPSPTGGAMIRLPGNRGFLVIKTEGPPGAGGRKKSPSRSIVALFFGADGVTPMNPPPTDVVINMGTEGKSRQVPLSPDAKDPNRFVSSPGPYTQNLQGEVRLKIGGEDVGESFSAM